jgi:2'-5' RNA ligase
VAPELAADHRAFPASPPLSLDDATTIVRHDWTSFAAVEHMSNHWDRPGWVNGRHAYYWMIIPRSPQLVSRAWHCQQELIHLGMDLIPPDGLHVTVIGIGDRGEVSLTCIDQLARYVRELQLRSFRLSAHPLAGSRGALRFSLTPWTPLVRLHAALAEAGRIAGVPGGKPTKIYRPHLGIAYNNRDRQARPVIEAASQLRTLPAASLSVTQLDLVELRRENSAYRWDTLHSVPLGDPAANH